ncbi:MAG: sigma-70 family RNA polymerase sigma factor [Chromatiaceae bacterium]|nr:sigma-70 family RNA polymerase sigma factor [Gammaproteobacteria bacterium]MCB1882094.1 sigma-70 family RNA polymerase sigma factor [Gammaproteobacteria bacterium]MCP5447294.1 sigma-70 family RNA polymerase sigma factor [Chromatiaceae bacterium]
MISRDDLVAEIPHLRRYARALTGQQGVADDLVQDTLERALSKWTFWKQGRALRPWLFSIMHNLQVDKIRRESRFVDGEDEAMPLVPQRADQEYQLEVRDLDRALTLLPVDQREVLLLVCLEELSYTEAAKVLGVPQGTVMSRLSRARARLKSILSGELVPQLKVVKP